MDDRRLAQILADCSTDPETGLPNAERVEAACKCVEESRMGAQAKIRTLKLFGRQISHRTEQSRVLVESSGDLDARAKESIKAFVERRYPLKKFAYEFAVNAALVGGVRIRVGDDLYERNFARDIQTIKNDTK